MSFVTHHASIYDLHKLIKLRTRVHTLVVLESDGILTACTAKSVKAKNMFKSKFLNVVGIYNAKVSMYELAEDVEEVQNAMNIPPITA